MGFRVALGEICSFNRGASIPRARMRNSGDLLYIHYGDLYKRFDLRIDVEKPAKPLPFISADEKIKDSQRLNDQDIVYVLTSETVDDLGHAYLFNNPSGKLAVSGTETTIVRVERKDIVLPAYLNYLMSSPRFIGELRQYTRGMKVFRVHPSDVARIEVDLPSIDEQQKVVAILDAVYEKQQINTQLNGYLAELAQTLYNDWFRDFGHWGGRMPSHWESGVLGDYVSVKRGGSPRPIQEYLSNEGLHWLKIADVSGVNGPYILEIKEHIKEEGLRKTVHLEPGSLVLSNSATPGIPKILSIGTCIHDGWLYFPQSEFTNEWLYCYFLNIRQELVRMANGSVFQNLKTDIVKDFEIIRPDDETLDSFQEIIAPLFGLMEACQQESKQLAALRDALLPKLMSGEIDVSKIDLTQLNSHLVERWPSPLQLQDYR